MTDTPNPPTPEVEGGLGLAGGDPAEGDADQPAARRQRPDPAPVVRIGGPDRTPFVLVAAAVLFVAVALIKPWPSGGGTPRPLPGNTPAPTVAPTVDPLAAIRLDCQDPPGWRVFSRERWARGVLRSWRTLDPAHVASGPLDPAIPDLSIWPGIVALGYCAIWSGPDRPPDDGVVHVWSVGPAGGEATPIDLVSASVTLHPPLGALFAPPVRTTPVEATAPSVPARAPSPTAAPGSPAPPAVWPTGTFVFEVTAGTFERWWAITILDDPTAPQPSATA
jgi:hypothetical protein